MMIRTVLARVAAGAVGVVTPGGPSVERLATQRVLLRDLRSATSRPARLLSDRLAVGAATLYLFGVAAAMEAIPESRDVWIFVGDGRARLRASPIAGGAFALSADEFEGLRVAVTRKR